jgi:YbbR domain-containing protein
LLKIMALLFAVILWSYVLAEINPPRERILQDIPVRYQNMEDLTAKNLAISGSLSDMPESVDILVEVNQSDIKYLSDENIEAYVDLSMINSTGERTLRIKTTPRRVQVLKVYPSEVTLYTDAYVTRTVPVNIDIIGNVPSGYYASIPVITPNVIGISGARVDVEKVESAVCTIDLNGLTQGYNKSMEVTLLDSRGEIIDASLFSGNLQSVIVNLSVLPKKTVSVDAAGAILGQDSLAPGYEITGISCNPARVSIVGEKSVLDGITALPLVPYSVSSASGDIVVLLEYAPPEGVTVLDTDKAEVYISIREKTDVKKYSSVGIRQKNLSARQEAVIDQSTIDVTVLSGISEVSRLSRADIVPYVDLEGLKPGVYSLDVLFEIPDGFTAENFSSTPATVTVTVKRK